MTTMGVYIRDLLLGQYYFDTLFPRIPVPVMRQIVSNLERMKLPSKHMGVTGETTRHGSDDTARRPPSVKAVLSVSFGQRAPHRASTRDSSPVRRTLALPYDRTGDDPRGSPRRHRSRSHEFSDHEYMDEDKDRGRGREGNRDRELDRERDRDRLRDKHRERDINRDRDRRYDSDRRSKYSDRESSRRVYERSSRRDCKKSNSCRSRSRSRSVQAGSVRSDHSGVKNNDLKIGERTSASSNLEKLKDIYGDTVNGKEGSSMGRASIRDSSTEEVIRLGGPSWK